MKRFIRRFSVCINQVFIRKFRRAKHIQSGRLFEEETCLTRNGSSCQPGNSDRGGCRGLWSWFPAATPTPENTPLPAATPTLEFEQRPELPAPATQGDIEVGAHKLSYQC